MGSKTSKQQQQQSSTEGIELGPILARTLGVNTLKGTPPNGVIKLIERLDTSNLDKYSEKAFELYTHSFPNPDEREPTEGIAERINRYSKKGPETDGGEFHAHVYLDGDGRVLGYAQGSIMPCGKAGLAYFWQYGAVADQDFMAKAYGDKEFSARKLGVSKLMHSIHDRSLEASAKKFKSVPLGEIWESEEKGLGETDEDIRFTHQRLDIHCRAGGRVMLGFNKSSKELVNLHLQPRLSETSEPIALHLMLRDLNASAVQEAAEISIDLAKSIIIDGFLGIFITEGADKVDVDAAKQEILSRLEKCDCVKLLPATEVPDVVTLSTTDDLLAKQLLEMYEVESLDQAREKYDNAMKGFA